jgi:voltage-gated potassium channel
LEQVVVPSTSPLAGRRMADCGIREQTGALVLALRPPDGGFESNPGGDSVLVVGSTLVVIGTTEQLGALDRCLRTGTGSPSTSGSGRG